MYADKVALHAFGPFSGTTQVSRHQKSKTNLDFTEARDSEWQWHQLGHMQVCISLQTDNYASNPLLKSILEAGCPSCRPTNCVKALKAKACHSCTVCTKAASPASLATVAKCCCNHCWDRHWQTDGWTPYHFIDPALHTMWVVSKTNNCFSFSHQQLLHINI